MRANAFVHYVLPCATLLLTLGMACATARAAESSAPKGCATICPRTLFLETITVRVFETSDMAENMLRSACIQASQRALAAWRAQAQTSQNPDVRGCAAQMGAQGCLMGQAFTQPHCTDIVCPLTQKCTVTLVRLDSAIGQGH